MTEDEINEVYKDVPTIIESTISMIDANSIVKIFEGDFILKSDKEEISIAGSFFFSWVASSGVHFTGVLSNGSTHLQSLFPGQTAYKVIVKGLEFGKGAINSMTLDGGSSSTTILGKIIGQAVFGDKSISVEKLKFSIPNLRDFLGDGVKYKTDKGFSVSSNRLVLVNDFYTITIDKSKDFTKQKQSLEEKGGYNILYTGELTTKKGSVKLEDCSEIFHCLATFLSFLNGRRTSAFFIQGIYKDEILWCDYTDYIVDSYKYVQSWPQKNSISGLSKTWEHFSSLWKDSNDKNFLISAIHWYVEANNNSGFTEGSIIMTQTALELLYNWWIIENKKMIVGKDSENLNASNKIRLLLSQLDISYEIPAAFGQLQQFVNDNESITDAPDAIVQIRNAIVHSQEEKRKKLDSIHYKAKHEALQLSIWYIEMTLLRILGFDDRYFNRCSGQPWASEIYPPWKKVK